MTTTSIAGRLLVDGALVRGTLVVTDGIVEDVLVGRGDGPHIVAPGFIDLQVNGAFGVEVGADPAALAAISARLPSTGTTSWLPTLVTSPRGEYDAALAAFQTYSAARAPGAEAIGLHLEGPLLAQAKKGAHRAAPMEQAASLLDELAAGGAVRLVTLAPERDGAVDLVRRLVARGVVVALGHTAGDAGDATRAADAGATLVTHLYNAMTPFSARAPGVVGQALVDDRLTCCLIVDLVHADRVAVELAVRAKGSSRICLVTDAMAAAGMGAGAYRLGGLDVTVDATSARLKDGTLAGSILTMDAAVRNAATTSLGISGALAAASSVPARVLGLGDRGALAVGRRADVVVLDGALRVVETWIAGERVFSV